MVAIPARLPPDRAGQLRSAFQNQPLAERSKLGRAAFELQVKEAPETDRFLERAIWNQVSQRALEYGKKVLVWFILLGPAVSCRAFLVAVASRTCCPSWHGRQMLKMPRRRCAT